MVSDFVFFFLPRTCVHGKPKRCIASSPMLRLIQLKHIRRIGGVEREYISRLDLAGRCTLQKLPEREILKGEKVQPYGYSISLVPEDSCGGLNRDTLSGRLRAIY